MTVQIRGAENVLDAVIVKLQQNLPNRIAAVNLVRDDFMLTAPQPMDYYVGKVQQIPRSPSIFVISDAISFNPTEGVHALRSDMDVCVYILESASSGQELERRMLRQVKCVIEALWDDAPMEALEGSAYRFVPRKARPGTPFSPTGNKDHLRQFYCLVFTASQFESD